MKIDRFALQSNERTSVDRGVNQRGRIRRYDDHGNAGMRDMEGIGESQAALARQMIVGDDDAHVFELRGLRIVGGRIELYDTMSVVAQVLSERGTKVAVVVQKQNSHRRCPFPAIRSHVLRDRLHEVFSASSMPRITGR
jgi:hypothetical protein